MYQTKQPSQKIDQGYYLPPHEAPSPMISSPAPPSHPSHTRPPLNHPQTEAFLSIDQHYYRAVVSSAVEKAAGTTALAALVWGGRVVVANAGDSRAVLSR